MSIDPQTSGNALPPVRTAGVCLHITSLPGRYGIGEIGDAAHGFVDLLRQMELNVWQFLPTGPTAYGDSPYQPLSTFAGNEMFIDIGDLVRAGLLRGNEADALLGLPSDTVDYGAVIPAKRKLLERAAARFASLAPATERAAYDDFLHAYDDRWLDDYAVFRILKREHDERAWTEWAPQYVQRDAKALEAVRKKFAAEIASIKVQQFLFDRQWRRLRKYAHEQGVMLFGDMPICIALDSSDAWAERDIVCLDDDGRPTHVAGVPPDYFSEDGQLWGNPLYDWQQHAKDGYDWWIERLNRTIEIADIVRIDHFRGFEAYWSVPSSASTARNGEWVPGPGDAIFVAMEESLGRLPIVAEDLGVITPEVEALRDRHAIPGMKVLQFEVSYEDFDPASIGEQCVCYTGTHDNDTTVGWFNGSPGDRRTKEEIQRTREAALAHTGGSSASIHNDLTRLAFATDARLAIAPMQDFLGLGSDARLNTPGKPGGNWRWRLEDDEITPALVDSVAGMVADAGRSARH